MAISLRRSERPKGDSKPKDLVHSNPDHGNHTQLRTSMHTSSVLSHRSTIQLKLHINISIAIVSAVRLAVCNAKRSLSVRLLYQSLGMRREKQQRGQIGHDQPSLSATRTWRIFSELLLADGLIYLIRLC